METKILNECESINSYVKGTKPTKSNQFDTESLYYKGVHYFMKDLHPNDNPNNKNPYKIQIVFYRGKWYQDTSYITEDFKNFLLSCSLT